MIRLRDIIGDSALVCSDIGVLVFRLKDHDGCN